jgi:predicted acetyltransferase
MIESRAVRSEELDSMLSLMCDSFGLPFTPARELFYRDPYFDIEKKRVLLVDGEIASCLTIVEAPLWIGRAAVRVGGIAGVATALDHRRKGFAARLLADTLPALREMGCAFSALFPFSYDYYRKLGWECVGSQAVARIDRSVLPPFAEARFARARQSSDRRPIAQLYRQSTERRSGRWIRDDLRWDYLFEHAKSQVVYRRQGATGYALYETREETEGVRTARVLELFADSDEARRGLVGWFAGMREVDEIRCTGSLADIAANPLVSFAHTASRPADSEPRLSLEPGVMLRVVDLPAALAALAPNFEGWRGRLLLAMADPQAPHDGPRGAELAGSPAGIAIEPLRAGDPRLSSSRRLEGDARAWSQVLAGSLSLRDALSLNRLRAFRPDAGVAAAFPETGLELFPRRDFFVPLADHF